MRSNSAEDLTEFDSVRKSILNYGLPDIVHRTIDETSVDDIRDEIETGTEELRAAARRAIAIHAARDDKPSSRTS